MRTEHFRQPPRKKKTAKDDGWTEAIGSRKPQPIVPAVPTTTDRPVKKKKNEKSPVMTYRGPRSDPTFDDRDPSFAEDDEDINESGSEDRSEHDSDFLDEDEDEDEDEPEDGKDDDAPDDIDEPDDGDKEPREKEKKSEKRRTVKVSAERMAQLEAEFDPLDFHDQLRKLRQTPWQKWYESVRATVEDFFTELTMALQKSSQLGGNNNNNNSTSTKSRSAASAIFTPEVTRTMQVALHMDYRPFVENWCSEYQTVLGDWNSAVDQLNAAFPFAKRLACPPGFSTRMLNTCDDLMHCAKRFHRLRDSMLEYADGCGWTCHRGLKRIFEGRTRRGDWTRHIAHLRTVCARFALICDRHCKTELLGDIRRVLDARPTHRTELSLAKRETQESSYHPLRQHHHRPVRHQERHRRRSSSSSSSNSSSVSSGSNDALFFLSPRRRHRKTHRHRSTKSSEHDDDDDDDDRSGKDIERKLRTFVPRAPRPMRLDHLKDV